MSLVRGTPTIRSVSGSFEEGVLQHLTVDVVYDILDETTMIVDTRTRKTLEVFPELEQGERRSIEAIFARIVQIVEGQL